MKIEDADRLFTKEDFWRLVLPQMIVLDLFFLSIPAFLGSTSSVANAAVATLITMPALWVAHAISYTRAPKCHEALKQEFGMRYTQLIERGELRISPMTILMTSTPAHAARLLASQSQ